MNTTLIRRAVTAGTVLVLATTAAVGAYATVQDPVGSRQGSLATVGPIADNGFPTYYKDSKGVRLEPCYTLDPLCGVTTANLADPAAPISFPDNFPDEFFYQLSSSNTTPLGTKLLVETNLEGAFANGGAAAGDQMVFARVRIKDVDVPQGTTWRITHPYGVDVLKADDPKKPGIVFTQDVGTVPGVFTDALNSRLGPFLKWDPTITPAAPAGYIGDPGILHAVTGSPYGTNFIKVEQLNPATNTYTTILQDDQFSLQGRLAVNSGVNVDGANFSTGSNGNSNLDVYASSEPGQAISVSANAALHTNSIPMREQDGHYYARIPVTGTVPAGTTIEVVNTGDKPPAKKTVALADQVIITSATYNADTNSVTVSATSSDTETGGGAATLTVAGYGALTNGTATFPAMNAPAPTVKVTSSRGGSDASQLTVTGAGFTTAKPVAIFPAPANAQVGQPIPLDGTGSTGDVTSYAWSTTNGTVTPTTLGHAVWTPTGIGTANITLTVSGPGGTSDPLTRTVDVVAPAGVHANAGLDQIVQRGLAFTLDASATTGEASVSWEQTGGPRVLPIGTTTATANPTFTYPLMALPVGPAGKVNTGYTVLNAPMVFTLTAKAADGTTSTDEVVISPKAETLTGLTARYRNRGEWRVTGTTSILAGQTVAMVLGSNPATGQYIGQASADAVGAFSFKGTTVPVGTGQTTVTYISATGGIATGTLLVTP